jgi:hypothetical protein
MPIAGLVAGVLCASVGWVVVTQGVRLARAQRQAHIDAEQALVTDCLANVDRVIDLPDWNLPVEPVNGDDVIDLRERALSAPAQVWSVDDATVA